MFEYDFLKGNDFFVNAPVRKVCSIRTVHRESPFAAFAYMVSVKPFGPHQLAMCSEIVHTFHIHSMGALKDLVMRSSRAFVFSIFYSTNNRFVL